MIRNYFKIAWRSLWKHKVFSFINIISLSIGLSASFVIGLMVYYDLTFDTFHEDSDTIYRVTSNFYSNEDEYYNPGVSTALMVALKENFEGIETAASVYTEGFVKVERSQDGKTFKRPDYAAFVDPAFFEIFKYKWASGNPMGSLSDPNKVVLTRERATKYFPATPIEDIIGQTLLYNDSVQTTVSGIVENFEGRTDLLFQEFLSVPTSAKTNVGRAISKPNWDGTNSSNQIFIKIPNASAIPGIQQELDKLADEQRSDHAIKYNQKRRFHLQPLADLHFNNKYGIFNFSDRPANKSVMKGLGFIALFLLVLGCINFINLNTAQASQRAKEIGIRKTLGSSRKRLIFQFLGETFILTLLAAVVSVALSKWLLNIFSDFTPEGLEFSLFADPIIITFAVVLLLLVTLLAGFYPSLVLSQFKPVTVLKNQITNTQSKPTLRRFLTVFQFTIAQVFIIATLLVSKQIHYMMTEDMGFKTDAIASFYLPWHEKSFDKRIRLQEELQKIPGLSKVILAGNPPASTSTSTSDVTVIKDGNEIQVPVQFLSGDKTFIDLYDIELVAGRPPLNDTIRELVINETLMRTFSANTPQEALALQVQMNDKSYPIVGVVADFNQRSLKLPIEPMAIRGDWGRGGEWSHYGSIHVNLVNNGNVTETISKMEQAFKATYPDSDFELNFMDETVQKFYTQEQSLSKLLKWAMGLSVLISCLGLLGLVIYTTERRTKEIGIRKVLGASLSQLNTLLCKDFLFLVGIAFVVAAPLAYWGLNDWLQDFAFKTQISWWIFVVSGLGMMLLALIIMTIRTMRTAMRNPVHSLKTE